MLDGARIDEREWGLRGRDSRFRCVVARGAVVKAPRECATAAEAIRKEGMKEGRSLCFPERRKKLAGWLAGGLLQAPRAAIRRD